MLVKQTPTRRYNQPKGYNANAIRRCVRRDFTTPEIAGFKTKSFTRPDVEHHAEIDLVTGECRCSCEHFHYRLQPQVRNLDINAVSIATPLLWCKHIQRAVNNCVRRGEIVLNDDKSYALAAPDAQPVNAVVVPAHINPETGEVKPGYNPDGSFDYLSYFDA